MKVIKECMKDMANRQWRSDKRLIAGLTAVFEDGNEQMELKKIYIIEEFSKRKQILKLHFERAHYIPRKFNKSFFLRISRIEKKNPAAIQAEGKRPTWTIKKLDIFQVMVDARRKCNSG